MRKKKDDMINELAMKKKQQIMEARMGKRVLTRPSFGGFVGVGKLRQTYLKSLMQLLFEKDTSRYILINESFQRFSEMHTLGHENVGKAPRPSVLNLLFYRGATLKPNCKS